MLEVRLDGVFLVEVLDDLHGFVSSVGDLENVEVFFLDHVVGEQGVLEPVDQAFPILASDEDDRELNHLVGLDEGDGLGEFVEGAEAARHGDVALGIAHEDGLADEEIVEVDVLVGVDIGVEVLLERQVDVEADTRATALMRALVAGFHDAGATTGDDAEAVVGELFGDLNGHLVVFVARLGACGAEDGNARTCLRQLLHAFHKLGHDLENRP